MALLGTSDAAERRYRERYLPRQELNVSLVQPDQLTEILIDINNPVTPELLRGPPA